ncbi:MAG TPA: response regulator [Candidatus Saccharimonadales bacterium]|nr:response regulator [Candidatus Saccharimonadales bacterium]
MRKLLLVEDEPALRDAYQLILSTQPYDFDVAVNGQDALDKCAKKHYDLILLDLMMPVLDGVGFLERFATNGHTPSRVVVLSNLSSGQDLTRAISLGAQKSVLKAELSPKQLLAMVRYELES